MSRTVLALGAAMVTAAGCVWYLPALADLRAGADRPVSRRTGAAACLSGWITIGAVAALLLVVRAWWIPCGVAVAGAAVTAGVWGRAAVQRRREMQETARHWAELRDGALREGDGPSRLVFVALVACGLAAAAFTAVVALAAGPDDGLHWVLAVAVPAAVVGMFLTAAIAFTHAARRATAGHARPSR
ncbi:hypothetical protein [Streptomyces colonosanans]|uniref:hypothetical protein n=1 Tax=Streptomyces colonosanans TaxID=1428652 RepID=UPI000D1A824C|nr:hypothetical protein [Streptomyces colonosanans]